MVEKQINKKIRLLVDCHVLDGKFQGTRTYIQGLYQEMIKHKNIDFYFAAQNTDLLARVFGKADNIHYIKLESSGSIKRLALEFPKIIKKFDIDYAHFQYISPLVKKCKEIVTIHDLLFMDYPQYFPFTYRIKNKLLFERSAIKADILLTVSEFSKEEIMRHFGIGGDRISVTPNAVLPIEDSANLPNIYNKVGSEKYILTVGRIEPRKNFLILLRAFIELGLNKDGYKLVIIGAADLDYVEYTNYYKSMSVEEKDAVVMDVATFPELVSFYKHASLFVFPSLAEGFGIPPLEAIEYDCPLLCSNATAMSEFGLPDKYLFDPNDIDELKTKICKMLRESKCRIGNDKIRTKFSWKKSSEVFYEILTQSYRGGGYDIISCDNQAVCHLERRAA